jgi:hypothetical protein
MSSQITIRFSWRRPTSSVEVYSMTPTASHITSVGEHRDIPAVVRLVICSPMTDPPAIAVISTAASVVMGISYSHRIAPKEDEFVALADQVLGGE